MFWFPVLYFFLLWYMRYAVQGELHWKRVPNNLPQADGQPFFSVIISCRNEEKNLPLLLQVLSEQTLDKRYWELIVVDDQSEDATYDLACDFKIGNEQFKVLKNEGSGKKEAQKTGAKCAKGEWLCFLDADVEITKHWLAAIASTVTAKCDFYLLPVGVTSNKKWLTDFQKIENQFLMSITAASAFLNEPILANGANMVVRKSVFFESWRRRKDAHVSSGDDMYMLWDLKKVDKNRILFVADQRLIARHQPALTLADFFAQRLRWAAKSSSVQDKSAIATALVLAVMNACVVWMWLAVYLGLHSWMVAFLFHSLKIVAETFFSRPMRHFLQDKKNQLAMVGYGLLFPLFFFFIPLLALAFRPKWKNRRVVRS